jgi:hypothetical protein
MSNADFAKIAAHYEISEEKLSTDITLLQATLKADGSLDKVASDPAAYNYLLHHFINFDKIATAAGYDLANSDASTVVEKFDAYVRKMAEEEKKEKEEADKKDKKEEGETEVDKKAAAYEAKLAEAAQVDEGWRQAGRLLAQGYVEEMKTAASAANSNVDAHEAATVAHKATGEKLRDFVAVGKKKMEHGLSDAISAAKEHGQEALDWAKKNKGKTGVGAAAGLAAAGAAGYGIKKHLDSKKEGSAGPASSEKKAFDFKAAQIAFTKVAEAGYPQEDALNRLQHVLDYEAAHGGSQASEGVKAASAQGTGAEMRAWELLAQAGYEIVEKG